MWKFPIVECYYASLPNSLPNPTGSLNSAMVETFTLWKLANTKNQDIVFFCLWREPTVKHQPAHRCWLM